MRTCGACRGALRWDESLVTVALLHAPAGPGNYKACPRCVAAAEGEPPPPPATYPAGERIPRHPYRDDYLPICGMCREALFEGECCARIRLQVEDVVDTPTVEAGAYWACSRCISRWKPVVHARLIRDGRIPAHLGIKALGGRTMA